MIRQRIKVQQPQPKRIVVQRKPSVWDIFERQAQVMNEVGVLAGRLV